MEKCATKWTKREALGEQNTFIILVGTMISRGFPAVARIDRRCTQSSLKREDPFDSTYPYRSGWLSNITSGYLVTRCGRGEDQPGEGQ